MNINRRVFFSLLVSRPVQTTSISVTILEVFDNGAERKRDSAQPEGRQEGIAALVHHANPATRNAFADWLQSHPKHAVRVRTATGEEVPATIFRVRMCFGRGLIVLAKPVQIRERDLLIVLPS